ncbi:BlaI/MecI/CopY family transcriptional regulator [Paenibacillus flagellatus]|uniref:Transcriptional regulator n=1 Tax=Paenibacillus flagellatus TaxID=2211139 RepID=A0A2V5K2S4_9BACL|nr:BlaI/MecI/CopY family transcriptional regulator [Paenibacillus flagellatus]PYI51863.1 transcriptional regulator [Paenibacillus flagellatus]
MKPQHFKINEKGLNRFFGPLEAKVMDIVWSASESSIRDVQTKLGSDKSVSFNTVMTVMNRLADKGFLVKRPEGRTTLYRPVQTKEQFLDGRSKELSQELVDEFGPLVVSHMVDALEEADPALIDKLERKLKSLRKEPS